MPADWLAIIFNPSFPYRLVHTVFAAYLTTALVVGGVGAWHLLRGRAKDAATEGARVMFSMAMGMITVVAPLQILAGDQHGLNTLEHQPVKVMAMEGHFKSYTDGAPLILFGWPDEAKAETLYAVEIPKASSLILKHSLDAPLKGLDSVDRKEWPPVLIVFWSFRVMVGLGMAMLGLAAFSLLARVMHRLYDWTLLHLLALVMGPAGFVAVIAGWVTTEVGRQPYTVHGLLRTADSASPLQAPAVGDLAAGFHRRLLHRVRRRHLLHPAADEPPAAAGRGGARTRPAGAGGRPHAVAGGARHDRPAGRGELTMLTFDLPTIWAFIIAFAIFAYVVMDGFDLGIGILFSWIPAGRERDTAMNTIAPVWDGNETWLVLGGGGLLAAFPLAYGTILSALYAPIVAMLLALIFRGVAFEFRWRDPRHRPYWDVAFSIGSIMAAFAQGVTLGALLQGIAVQGSRLCRRLVRLADAVQHPGRREPGLRLCAARLDLADHEERGHPAGARLSTGAAARHRHHRRHRRGERGDAVPERRLLAPLVRLSAGHVHRGRAGAGRHRHPGLLHQPQAAPQLHAVPDGAARSSR